MDENSPYLKYKYGAVRNVYYIIDNIRQFFGALMSDTSPMIKKIRQMPAPPSSRAKSGFRIPKKGRIRFVLALLLTIAIVKWSWPYLFGRDQGGGKPVDGDIAKAESVDRRGGGKDQRKSAGDDPPKVRKTPFSAKDKKSRADESVAQERTPENPVPEMMMSFEDVRRLVEEYGVGVQASERIVVIDNSNEKAGGRLRGRDKDKGDDTLTISLSVDTSLQKYAAQMLQRYKPRYGAVAAVDPATGRVLALASFAGEGEPVDGKDLYLKSIFPAASIFKTIVAAAGIEKGGMNAKTPIQHFGGHHTLYRTQIQKDLKVSRDISLQDAYAYSVNPAFARIALFNVNKDIVVDYGERFGFNQKIPFEFAAETGEMFAPDSDFSVAEFASGFNRKTSISPLFGALIAAAICEGGVIYEPTVIDSIRSSKRDTLVYSRVKKIWRRAIKESTASEMRWLMNKVTHYGTARKTFRPLRDSPRFGRYEYGGKTGNVNKFGLGRVDWFVGFARDPGDKNKQIAIGVVTTHGEYWTVQSSYIASELFKKYIAQNQNLYPSTN
jgi:membrane peptidoglycan carboxypeptidase